MYSFYKVHPKCELHRIEILTTKSSDLLALTILTSIAHHHSLETEDHPVKARKSTRTSVCIHPACARNQVTVKNPPLSPSSFALSISLSLSLSLGRCGAPSFLTIASMARLAGGAPSPRLFEHAINDGARSEKTRRQQWQQPVTLT